MVQEREQEHTTETKEIFTEAEAVTVCWTVTGFGVGGACTEGVKTCENMEVVKDNGGERADGLRKVLDDSCGSAIGDVGGVGLKGDGTERDVIGGEDEVLTTCGEVVGSSMGLLLVAC